jgi:hypothetical protein
MGKLDRLVPVGDLRSGIGSRQDKFWITAYYFGQRASVIEFPDVLKFYDYFRYNS